MLVQQLMDKITQIHLVLLLKFNKVIEKKEAVCTELMRWLGNTLCCCLGRI